MSRLLWMCGVIGLTTFAYSEDQITQDQVVEQLNKITATTPRGVRGVTTSLENPNYAQQNWFFGLTTGAWQANMDGVTSFARFNTTAFDAVQYSFQYNEPTFNWGFSVKGEVGYSFDYDGWDLSLGYNYFHTKGHQNVNLPVTPELIPYLIPTHIEAINLTVPSLLSSESLSNVALSGSTSLNFILNNSFLKLGRSFFLSKSFSMKPNFGIQSTWFSASETARFSGGSLYYQIAPDGTVYYLAGLGDSALSIGNKFRFYAVGPRVGIDTKWYMTKCFNLYANATGSILFSYYDHRIKETYDLYPANFIKWRDKPRRIITSSDVEVGFGYDRDFNQLKQHLTLQIGCEFQNFNEANQFSALTLGGVSMYGFNFNLAFGF